MVLQGHVLYLDGKELAVLLHVVQDFTGLKCVHVGLEDGAVAECDHRIADALEPLDEGLLIKGVQIHFVAAEAQQELGAVAEFERRVRTELVKVNGGSLNGGHGTGFFVGYNSM